MRLLVTGGCGFIGSNFVRYVLAKYPNYHITNLDKLTYAGNPANLYDVECNPRYRFVKGDICDRELVDEITRDVDVIMNFAAETHVDRSIHEPGSFIHTDVTGTLVLLEAAIRYRVERYVQISTDEVYGSRETGYFRESDPLSPSSPYAAAKAAGDLLAMSFWTTYRLPILITRSSNNFGPYQYPEKLIPLFVTNALENHKLPLYGDGLNVRDWIYVLDNCAAIDCVLNRGKPGEIYNIGGGNEHRNVDIARLIVQELGKSEDCIEYVKDRPGHDRRYAIECTRVHLLGFTPLYSFGAALKDTIQWYRKNKMWWEKIKSGEFREYYGRMYG